VALSSARGPRLVPGAASPDRDAAPVADPDGELVAAAVAGERAAFEALLRRHYDRIYRVAWRMTGSATDAEDVAQEVCCTLVEKIGTFRNQAKFTTWLVGIVVNACSDHHRRVAALTRLRRHLATFAGLARAPDDRDLHGRLWLASAIARLDRPLRETVVLVVGEDMSHAEAAAALGVAESTVSWRMHQVRRRLAGKIDDGR